MRRSQDDLSLGEIPAKAHLTLLSHGNKYQSCLSLEKSKQVKRVIFESVEDSSAAIVRGHAGSMQRQPPPCPPLKKNVITFILCDGRNHVVCVCVYFYFYFFAAPIKHFGMTFQIRSFRCVFMLLTYLCSPSNRFKINWIQGSAARENRCIRFALGLSLAVCQCWTCS